MLINNDSTWRWPVSRKAQARYCLALRPTLDERTQCRSALGKVVNVCHRHTPDWLLVDRVQTVGSVGKGTSTTQSSDLDLVVYVRSLTPNADMGVQITNILDEIQGAMDQQYPGTRDLDFYRKYGLRYKINNMEIDILVGAVNVLPMDIREATHPSQQRYMSASVSYLSKKFIRKQNLMYQDLVRVVKDWRDSFVSGWEPCCKPKSYLLEILMLEACCQHKLCTKQGGRTTSAVPPPYWWIHRVLQTFFGLLARVEIRPDPNEAYDEHQLPPLFICFAPYYKHTDLPLQGPEPIFGTRHGRHAEFRAAMAIVMDPVNPTNNLWNTLADSGKQLVTRAKATLLEFHD